MHCRISHGPHRTTIECVTSDTNLILTDEKFNFTYKNEIQQIYEVIHATFTVSYGRSRLVIASEAILVKLGLECIG